MKVPRQEKRKSSQSQIRGVHYKHPNLCVLVKRKHNSTSAAILDARKKTQIKQNMCLYIHVYIYTLYIYNVYTIRLYIHIYEDVGNHRLFNRIENQAQKTSQVETHWSQTTHPFSSCYRQANLKLLCGHCHKLTSHMVRLMTLIQRWGALVYLGCYKKDTIHRLIIYKYQKVILFFIFLKAQKSIIKVPAGSMPTEGLLCVHTGWNGKWSP